LTLITSNATEFVLGTAAEHELGNDWTDIRTKYPAFVAYPWWVGGTFTGEGNEQVWDENGDTLFTNTVHLSTRDLSALKEGFTLITIGDNTTYRMIFGDAMDASIIKADESPRVRDSSFRDDIVLNADRIFIEGEVEAQSHSVDLLNVEMNADRLHVKSKNINNPMGGKDSGITGDILDLHGITNRIINDGWIITNFGDILVNIPGNGETYSSPMMKDAVDNAKRLNNYIQGVAGVLRTNKPGGVIEIITKNSVVLEGHTYVSGADSRIDILPGTFFELVQIAGAISSK